MANVDAPCGFQPWRHMSGGVIRANGYKITSAYAANIFSGDAVVATSGYLAVATASSAGLLGIFAGCQYRASDGSIVYSPYWPTTTATLGSEDAVGFVYDDPNIIYRAQTSDDVAFVLATHNMTLCDLVSTHTGSTVTGQSKQELLVGTTGDEQFLLLQMVDEPGNAVGNWAKVECRIKDSRTSSSYSA